MGLRMLREAAGLSQSQLERKSGVKLKAIQAYEQKYRDIGGMSLETAVKLADALGISDLRELLKEDEMKAHGREITEETMNAIAQHMSDELREQVHAELAPCTSEAFIKRYVELDPSFAELLESEFGIEM